jgi:phosphomevalonate kinase
MKARAPGKLVLAGAYAVLEGHPALVVAVDRFATADTDVCTMHASRELARAFGPGPYPSVDVHEFYADGAHFEAQATGQTLGQKLGQKLGLGSSAASVVAALAASFDLSEAALFERAYAAHGTNGSGIDVAASVYGGVLEYVRGGKVRKLSQQSAISVWFSGTSVRTDEMVSAVQGLKARDLARYESCIIQIASNSRAVLEAWGSPSAWRAFAAYGDSLDALGLAAACACAEHAAFVPSGAGGGDVGVYVGGPPSETFRAKALTLGFSEVPLSLSHRGVHRLEQGNAS